MFGLRHTRPWYWYHPRITYPFSMWPISSPFVSTLSCLAAVPLCDWWKGLKGSSNWGIVLPQSVCTWGRRTTQFQLLKGGVWTYYIMAYVKDWMLEVYVFNHFGLIFHFYFNKLYSVTCPTLLLKHKLSNNWTERNCKTGSLLLSHVTVTDLLLYTRCSSCLHQPGSRGQH